MDKRYTTILRTSLLALFPLGMVAQTAPPSAVGPAAANTVYSQAFDTEDDFLDFTAIDKDGDGNKWSYDAEGKAAKYKYSNSWGYKCSDYLVTPEVELKAGTKYTLSFFIKGQQGLTTFCGEYSALVGQGDDPASYNDVVPVTQIRSDKGDVARNETKTFTVDKDGMYHLTFRISNDSGQGSDGLSMLLDDISVLAASAAAPDSVTNLTAASDGSNLKATITFKAPTKALDGTELTAIGKIEVYRGETLVKTIDSPAPGSVQTVTDESPVAGTNTYRVVPYSTDGSSGEEAKVSVWVGKDVPKSVTGLKLTRTDDGKAALSWNTPTGVNGGVINPDEVTYTVTRFPDNVVVSKDGHETTLTDAVASDKSNIYYYTVKPFNGELEGEAATSGKMYLGKSYEVPYSESFDSAPTETYTIIDANNDGATWVWNEQVKAMTNKYAWNSADDWLLSPTLKLESGWAYNLSFGAASSSDNADQIEKLSVSYGKGGDVSSFKEIWPTTEIHGQTYKMMSRNFDVREDGDYQVGFHLTSDMIKWGVWVDSVQVKKFVWLAAPDSVTNIKITPAAEGKLAATVSFKAPTQTAGLDPLTSLTKIEVYRSEANGKDFTLIHTFDNPQVGSDLSFTDDAPAVGFNLYYIRPYNGEGEKGIGITNVSSQYIGEDIPFAPTDLVDKDNFDGTITLTWEAPAEDHGQNGKYVNPDKLKYNVYRSDGTLVATTEPGVTTATIQISTTGNQTPVHFTVYAVSNGGQSAEGVDSKEIMLGAYANLPFRESFKGGTMKQQWWANYDQSNLVGTYNLSSDNDGASFSFLSFKAGSEFTFESGKIRTEDAANPRLAFTYYTTYEQNPSIDVYAVTPDHREVKLTSVDIAQDLDWHRVTVDVPQISAEKYIRLLFRMKIDGAYPNPMGMMLLDNIDLREMRDYDLAIESMTTPYKVTAGKDFEANVIVENFGLNAAEEGDYTVDLYVNDEKAMEMPGETIQPDETKEYTFSFPTTLKAEKPYSVYAKINYVSDLRPDNDESAHNTVVVRVPGYTTVDDLVAENGKLSWSMPTDKGRQMLEDFENYEHGQIDGYDPWTSYDFDGQLTMAAYLGAQGNLPNKEQPIAFQVFNPVTLGLNLDYNPGTVAHSGNQYMVSWGGYDDNEYKLLPHDDMLVSPELSGNAQTVKFWIKSMYARWDRAFDLLLSTTTNEADAFDLANPYLHDIETPIDEENDIYKWNDWTEYSVEIPAGTKYFAIRAYGIDTTTPNTYMKPGYMFMLDDVEYNAPSPAITGYNIYSDDKKVGTVKASEPTTFNAEYGHRYNVTVLYDDGGESSYSNDATFATGIENAESADEASLISTADGKIVVRNAEGKTVSVFTTGGAKVYSAAGNGYSEIPVQRGQYIVRVGKTVKKVIVNE